MLAVLDKSTFRMGVVIKGDWWFTATKPMPGEINIKFLKSKLRILKTFVVIIYFFLNNYSNVTRTSQIATTFFFLFWAKSISVFDMNLSIYKFLPPAAVNPPIFPLWVLKQSITCLAHCCYKFNPCLHQLHLPKRDWIATLYYTASGSYTTCPPTNKYSITGILCRDDIAYTSSRTILLLLAIYGNDWFYFH